MAKEMIVAEHGADPQRQSGRRWIAQSQAEADAGEHRDVTAWSPTKSSHLPRRDLYKGRAQDRHLPIDTGGKLQEKRARDKISARENHPKKMPMSIDTIESWFGEKGARIRIFDR